MSAGVIGEDVCAVVGEDVGAVAGEGVGEFCCVQALHEIKTAMAAVRRKESF